jgi:hypothetical protein
MVFPSRKILRLEKNEFSRREKEWPSAANFAPGFPQDGA